MTIPAIFINLTVFTQELNMENPYTAA